MDKGDLYYFFDSLIIANVIRENNNRNNENRKFIKEKLKNEKALVSIISYCLLPNHFHLILKQEVEGGISKFMQKLGTSYARYFNEKYERSGSLFQGKFKATIIRSEYGLPTLTTYVNLNYKHHGINPENNLVKTSLFEFLGTEKGELVCNQEEIERVISEVGDLEDYKKYMKRISKAFGEKKGVVLSDIDFDKDFE
jgi:REP element-mobilizing transposase RayT